MYWRSCFDGNGLSGLVPELFDERLENLKARFKILLIILPAANGRRVERFADRLVGRGSNGFGFEPLAVLQHLRRPRQFEKIERTPGLRLEICDAVFIAEFEPGRSDKIAEPEPGPEIVGIAP